MSYTNPINIIIVWYVIIITSNMHIYGRAITLPSNAKPPALLVFGDSIVDSGNNDYIDTIGKANFPPYGRDFAGGVATGRYSNGKIPSDLIAEQMGLKELVPPYLDPSLQINDLLTGVSFASGAAGYDPQSAKIANAISLDKQLILFKQYINRLKAAVGDNTTSTIISQSVYLVCAGSNDITNTYFALPFRKLHYNVSSYTSLMVNWASTFVQELYDLGARRIGVISAPPCGCLPSQRTLHGGHNRSCAEKENQASIIYNTKLSSELKSLNQKLNGSNVAYLDIYDSALNLITNPSQSGFEVANKGCCGTGNIEVSFLCTKLDIGTCKDASKYIFWDSFHPTEAAYRIIVNDIVQKNHNLFF
ncbi:GDSL esterase/lipase EXL1-like [Silene latifolia]|uniref:GDSL esterase/lipase EXL1-like n=1 Tax=Silene latifolia TaxID=37657 RepID=UPI003D775CEE